VKAVVCHGEIRPLEPLPADWQEGQSLHVEKADDGNATVEAIDGDFAALAALCEGNEPADEEQLQRALQEAAPPGQGPGSPPDGFCLMLDYLLDCNHLSAAVRKVSLVRERIHQARRAAHRFITCYPVLCELEVGIQQTPKPEDNRRRLNQLLRQVRLWPLDAVTAQHYGAVWLELRRLGRVPSQVDIMAALARQHKLTVLTTDRDFEALTDLQTENGVP
jgi:predicted nucleic acid-binding protein